MQTLQEKLELLDENKQLKKQLEEKLNEIAVLKVQNTTYATDFQQEREDRTRLQSRLIELEEKLVELENGRGRFSTTTRHQVSNASSSLIGMVFTDQFSCLDSANGRSTVCIYTITFQQNDRPIYLAWCFTLTQSRSGSYVRVHG